MPRRHETSLTRTRIDRDYENLRAGKLISRIALTQSSMCPTIRLSTDAACSPIAVARVRYDG